MVNIAKEQMQLGKVFERMQLGKVFGHKFRHSVKKVKTRTY